MLTMSTPTRYDAANGCVSPETLGSVPPWRPAPGPPRRGGADDSGRWRFGAHAPRGGRAARRLADRALSPLRRQVGAAQRGLRRRFPRAGRRARARLEGRGRRHCRLRSDGPRLRAVRARQPVALPRDVRCVEQRRASRSEPAGGGHAGVPAARGRPRGAPARRRGRREESAVAVARYVWAVVHGIAMLGIDGRLPDESGGPGGVRDVTSFAVRRLGTGIFLTEPSLPSAPSAR